MPKIGIIGGSGLEKPDILKSATGINADTPYGPVASPLLCGTIKGTDVVILSRHGHKHTIPPSQVNNRANIHALREIGCTHIISATACGSLREEIGRGHLVFPDQLIDFTHHRIHSFFDEFEPGKMRHTPMADPFDKNLRKILAETASELNLKYHSGGTLITIEGPRFSTRAESRMFRMWGADIINMSVAPEVILANETGIPYAAVAMATDYDSWKDDEDPVTWEEVLRIFESNVEKVVRLLIKMIPAIV